MNADSPTDRPVSRALRWLSRFFFLAAVGAALYGRHLRQARLEREAARPPALRQQPVAIDWRREPFRTWQSAEDGIRVEYPARFDEARGFGRFTSRDLAGRITETDVVAFRSGVPRAVITLAAYHAPRPLSWQEWVALARAPIPPPANVRSRAPSVFAAEFGGSERRFEPVRVGDREGLRVRAQGAVKYPMRGNETIELWDFDSRLVADGDQAVRITAGVHHDQYAGTCPGLERCLNSFRWSPPGGKG